MVVHQVYLDHWPYQKKRLYDPWVKNGYDWSPLQILLRFLPVDLCINKPEKMEIKGAFTNYVYKIRLFWPPNLLCLHFLWYESLQKVDFFDHLPPSSCKRSLWTPPYLTSLTWIQMTWLFPWPKISVTQGLGVLRVRMNCSDLFKCCISTLN